MDVIILIAILATAFVLTRFVRDWMGLFSIVILPLVALVYQDWHVNGFVALSLALSTIGVGVGVRVKRRATYKEWTLWNLYRNEDRANEEFYDASHDKTVDGDAR